MTRPIKAHFISHLLFAKDYLDAQGKISISLQLIVFEWTRKRIAFTYSMAVIVHESSGRLSWLRLKLKFLLLDYCRLFLVHFSEGP